MNSYDREVDKIAEAALASGDGLECSAYTWQVRQVKSSSYGSGFPQISTGPLI